MLNDDEAPFDFDKLRDDEVLVEQRFWDKLKATFGKIPFAEDAVASYYCAIDKQTPLYVRAVLMGALAYFIIPVDVIPDVIAGLGFTDDASVLAAAIAAVRSQIRDGHIERARLFLMKAKEDQANGDNNNAQPP